MCRKTHRADDTLLADSNPNCNQVFLVTFDESKILADHRFPSDSLIEILYINCIAKLDTLR